MKGQQSFRLSEMGDLEDTVCRASHSAELALALVEVITDGSADVLKIPLSKDQRELLYFAVSEANDYAAKAKYEFYKLGETPS